MGLRVLTTEERNKYIVAMTSTMDRLIAEGQLEDIDKLIKALYSVGAIEEARQYEAKLVVTIPHLLYNNIIATGETI